MTLLSSKWISVSDPLPHVLHVELGRIPARHRRAGTLPCPVIVAVHGLVGGLGIAIISAYDIRYASEGTQFTIKEVDVGLAADIGTLAYVRKVIGSHSLLREVAYTARLFFADEAARMGLLSTVVPGGRDEVIAAALKLAGVTASKSPIAVSGVYFIIIPRLFYVALGSTDDVLSPAWRITSNTPLPGTALPCRPTYEFHFIFPPELRAMTRTPPVFAPLRKASVKL
ncbi:ClpP/crotonase-like domain-containing protein [Mycena filopes]|nr:ClpP/crotonase-like domain-containing protein [Mycena filopes]